MCTTAAIWLSPPSCIASMAASSAAAIAVGAESFRDVWARRDFPVIKTDYEELVLMAPLRVKARQEKRFAKKGHREHTEDAAVIKRKTHSVMEVVREKSECRNAYMNLACTVPGDNSRLQVNISYDRVANMAVDMFCDT